MTAIQAQSQGAEERPAQTTLMAWLAIAAGTIGGFMALLDTSIANAALPIIQGEIGATQSEGTWIGTAYLTTEIIVVPLVAWIERMIGMRRFLLISALAFTFFSVVCGMASDLTTMIVGRLGQGLSGGMMMPTAYSLVARLLPPGDQSRGVAIVSGPILIAPIIGPLLGGWLTENYSWHYAFFINVPICAVLITLLLLGVPRQDGEPGELANADWFGISGMVIGLGALTVMLEEGHREQWFASALIWKLAIAAMIGFLLIAIGQLRPGRPVLDLRLLKDRVIGPATMLLVMMGAAMFCLLFAVPQFLVIVRGYNAYQAGQVAVAAGVTSFLAMFIYPIVMERVDVRLTVAVSMVILAMSGYVAVGLTSETPGGSFALQMMLMGLGVSMTAIPLQQVAIFSVGPSMASEISSIITIARNLGGALGLAGLASFQEQRLEFHHWRLQETVSANDPAVWERLAGYANMFGGGEEGWTAAYRMFDAGIMRDALVMTFDDIFFALAVGTVAVIPFVLIMRPVKPESSQTVMH